ncbi:hypothetical protein Tco_1415422 [Tanacetum coccineum]
MDEGLRARISKGSSRGDSQSIILNDVNASMNKQAGKRLQPRRACRGRPTKNDTTNVNDGGSNRINEGGSDDDGNTSTSGSTVVTGSMVSNTTFGHNLNDSGVGDVSTDFTAGRSNFTSSMFETSKFTSSMTEVTVPNSSFTGNVEGTLTSSISEVTGGVFSSMAEQTSPTPEC